LSHALKIFKFPSDEYVPHMTLGRVFKEASAPDVDRCIVAAQNLLPLTVAIEPIHFFAHQEL
jgi:hypothetical protein